MTSNHTDPEADGKTRRSALKELGVGLVGGPVLSATFSGMATSSQDDGSALTANVGSQPPVMITDYPYTETLHVVWDGTYYDGIDIQVDRERLSKTEHHLTFRFEKASRVLNEIHGYGYSQILVLVSHLEVAEDGITARVNGGEPWGLVLADLALTISGSMDDLIEEPIKELAKEVTKETGKKEVTSRLQYRVPPAVETVDDVTALRLDFSTDTLPTSPASIDEFELELDLSFAEKAGEPTVSIIPDLRAQTVAQPTDNSFTRANPLPVEYRRQLIATFPTATPAETPYEIVEHRLCTDVQEDQAGARCAGPGSTFSTDDSAVYNLIKFTDASTVSTVTWKWYTPSGRLYFEYTYTNDEEYSVLYAYSYIDVRGETPATLPGEWSVRTIVNNGELQFMDRFTIH